MRLFIAVGIGDAARAQAGVVRRELDRRDAELSRRGLKWVEPANLHMTVRFLGEVAEPLASEIIEVLRAPIDLAPFTLAFGPPSWLPGGARPRVLMLPLVGGASPLGALKEVLDLRLPAGVLAEDPRPFRPHLTLARVRDGWRDRGKGAGAALEGIGPVPDGGQVDAAVLFESHLGARGPVYHERARARLTGAR